MKFSRLKRSFFIRDTLTVAKELLGKYLVKKIGNKKLVGRIVETEAYIGRKNPGDFTLKVIPLYQGSSLSD